MKNKEKSYVLWLTGISGSGKTTLAIGLARKLRSVYKDLKIEIIDGDLVRSFFNDSGYTREARENNIKRIIFTAALLSKNGIFTIVANIAPYKEIRKFAREKIDNYLEIYVRASVEACAKRDVKDLYKKYRRGEMKNIIGLDDKYDVPENPDFIVDTEKEKVKESIENILSFIREKKIFD